MNVLAKNPVIYETFRDGLKEHFYTHWGVSYSLQHFLDNRILIPEIKEDIVSHPLNRSRRGLFAYLGTAVNGSPQPCRRHTQRTCSVSPPSSEPEKEPSTHYFDTLSLPSLQNIEQSSDDDDDESDGIVSVDDMGYVTVCNWSTPNTLAFVLDILFSFPQLVECISPAAERATLATRVFRKVISRNLFNEILLVLTVKLSKTYAFTTTYIHHRDFSTMLVHCCSTV